MCAGASMCEYSELSTLICVVFHFWTCARKHLSQPLSVYGSPNVDSLSFAVDLHHQQHLQTDLPDWQPRGARHWRHLSCSNTAGSQLAVKNGSISPLTSGVPILTFLSCFLSGGGHPAEPNSDRGSHSHYQLWEKTRRLPQPWQVSTIQIFSQLWSRIFTTVTTHTADVLWCLNFCLNVWAVDVHL